MDKKQIDELIEELAVLQCEYSKQSDMCENDYEPDFPYFHRVYPLTNEDLNQYFARLNLKNSKVMTVGSSGDQVLYSLAYGSKDVTHVDINPFSKFYRDLKIAAIKNFDYKDFIKFFSYLRRGSTIIKSKLYRKISHLLPQDSRYFWDNIFLEFDYLSGFTHLTNEVKDHYVYDENQYNQIKSALNNDYKLRFQCVDITDILPYIKDEKYDAIFLSNIYDYVDTWQRKKIEQDSKFKYYSSQQIEFFNICNGLLNSLNPNGILQVQYGFNYVRREVAKMTFGYIFEDYQVYDIPTNSGGGPVIIQNSPREKELER